jgi:hypothetical protein
MADQGAAYCLPRTSIEALSDNAEHSAVKCVGQTELPKTTVNNH